ncbi:molybdopterin-dependent oxidoreductase [Microvirga sp. 2MCAF38]|uniref:molybdopterin-dependent oxidoreductase n=1 Tax=Microvirga sp. 2MCAF38 TaxID=3232989 RepID=UPI003F9B77FE
MRTAVTTLVGFIGLVCASFSHAEPLPAPTEKPILTVSGKIDTTNKDDSAQFDLSMLLGLGLVTVETTTPWYNGPVKFEGISLDKLMKRVGAKGERVVAVALNDYSSEIPIEDFAKYNVILALKRNGEYMPIRDKGPLFIIYPFDSIPELKSQTYYGRSVWQVAKLIVK